ncbi:ABC transporter permease subunit [Halopelagius longus]|uniref:ABC-2 family transporter protein n=1 Tax=Halopelagius longus TaxID=1236180 RepID=A0A1H1G2B3_9EURY|nr:ABC transporter permease subunit [Halopelagius longus]RDI69889.1 nitrite reductase [Halopelagius longus]SDR07283.1 ABC-2 family transporter protein [Halopelagius longus]
MQWSPLARQECRTVLFSKGTWILALLVVLWGYRPTYAGWEAVGRNITIGYIQIGASLFLPTGVLLLCYQSLIGERTSGSIKLLLALPLTRTHIVFGKAFGRFLGIGAATLLAVFALVTAGFVDHGPFAILPFLATLLATLLLVAVFVVLGILLSAVTQRTVAAASAIVAYFLVSMFWNQIVSTVYSAVTGTPVDPYSPPANGPLFFALRLAPTGAYKAVTNWILGVGNSTELFQIVQMKLTPGVGINAFVVESAFQGAPVPWYLHPAVGLVILLVWLIVPLGVARFAFERGDAL